MTELTQIADMYAAEKTNEVMAKAIAQAFADGYRAGYHDCKDTILVDLRDKQTEFIDLGLPSGTLWAKDHEATNGCYMYLPYDDAAKLSIPTETQWDDLLKTCRFIWSVKNYNYECIGPNGNFITFSIAGYKITDNEEQNSFAFWVNSDTEQLTNKSASLVNGRKGIEGYLYPVYMGYKLPIRLVRTK